MLCASLRPPLEKGEMCVYLCVCLCVCATFLHLKLSLAWPQHASRAISINSCWRSLPSLYISFFQFLSATQAFALCLFVGVGFICETTHTHTHTNSHTARQRDRQTLELPSFTPALVAAAAQNDNDDEGDTSIIFCCSNVEISSQRLKCTLVLSLPAVGSTPNSAPVPTVTPSPPLHQPLPGPSNLLNHTSN